MDQDPSQGVPGTPEPPQGDPGVYPGGARPKQYSNVIVDDSPLQNQMQKNKECKIISSFWYKKISGIYLIGL